MKLLAAVGMVVGLLSVVTCLNNDEPTADEVTYCRTTKTQFYGLFDYYGGIDPYFEEFVSS